MPININIYIYIYVRQTAPNTPPEELVQCRYSQPCVRLGPHRLIVTTRDNIKNIKVPTYSCHTTVTASAPALNHIASCPSLCIGVLKL